MSERMTGFATSLAMKESLDLLFGRAFQTSDISRRTTSKYGAVDYGGRVVHFDMPESMVRAIWYPGTSQWRRCEFPE